MDSILTSIKKLLGGEANYTNFDSDIIIYINSAFARLSELGIGPTAFFISDKSKVWTDYIAGNINYGRLQAYVYLKVRLIFDPPTSSFVLEAMERQVKELEWEFQVEADYAETIS